MSEKKSLSPLVWIAIGCGGLLLAGTVAVGIGGFLLARKAKDVVEEVARDFEENPAKAAAEMVVRLNPELDVLNSDDEAGTMTIRNNRTGEEATFDFDEIKQGRFSFETAEGKVELDASLAGEEGALTVTTEEGETRFGAGSAAQLPAWVPVYPGSEPAVAYSSSGPQGESGALSFETGDDPIAVLDHYEERLEREGYELTRHTVDSGGQTQGMLGGEREAGKRILNVSAVREGESTKVVVQYSGAE